MGFIFLFVAGLKANCCNNNSEKMIFMKTSTQPANSSQKSKPKSKSSGDSSRELISIAQSNIPFDHVDKEDLEKPPKWKIENIRQFMIFIIMAVGIYLPFSPIASSLGFMSLPAVYFLWLACLLTCYCVLTQFVKTWFIKKYGYN